MPGPQLGSVPGILGIFQPWPWSVSVGASVCPGHFNVCPGHLSPADPLLERLSRASRAKAYFFSRKSQRRKQ
jgi:hypothetical protein